jgi:hypothetical protein
MTTIKLGGLEVKVVSEAEAEATDACICMLADYNSPFTDNEFGVCSKCGAAVMFRPYMPKKPPKICMPCFVLMSVN